MDPLVRVMWETWADQALGVPVYATAGAAGADVRANFPPEQRDGGLVLGPMARVIVPTGIRLELPEGCEAQIRPRSGLALKHGITLLNSPGTIDCDYRGALGVLLVNLGGEAFAISHGDRIAQMIVAPVARARFAVVGVLGDTVRGGSGFGSTGKG